MKSHFNKIWLPLCFLALLSGLIGLGELRQAPYRNDGALHLHQIERMDAAFDQGQSLLDHWDPVLGLGYPFPRTYSMLSHLLVWASYRICGKGLPLAFFYGFWTWLLWLSWPLSVYVGSRLLGLQLDQALGAALACILMHTSFRFGIAPETYFWIGYGLLPNLLGLVLLPLAVGTGVRFLRGGQGLFPALILLTATWFAHLVMGYIASFSLAVCTLFLLQQQGFRTIALRLATLGGLCLAVCAFFLYPYFVEGHLINHTAWEPAHYWDSYGPGQVLLALVSGNLLDHKMALPVLSLLLPLGYWRIFAERHDTRLVAALGTFWFLAFLGRSAWNPAGWLLLFNDHVPFERFLVPTQWFFGMIAGIGLAYAAKRLKQWQLPGGVPLLLCLLPLAPHLAMNIYQHPIKAGAFKAEIRRDFQDLSARLPQTLPLLQSMQDGGRVLVPHDRQKKHKSISYNQIPLDANLPHVGALWHSMALNSEYFAALNPTRTSHLNLFAIKFVLAPKDTWPNAAIRPLNDDREFALYTNHHYDGLFTMGRLEEELAETPDERRTQINQWLASGKLDEGRYLYLSGNVKPNSDKGQDPRQGFFKGGLSIEEKGATRIALKTRSQHAGWLIGRFSYHPGWQVTIDGQSQNTIMVSPSFPAVYLEPGDHDVVFTYVANPWTRRLGYLSLLILAATALKPSVNAMRSGWQKPRET